MSEIIDISEKRILPTFLLFLVLSWPLGAHRFFLRRYASAILFIITIGGFGIWWIVGNKAAFPRGFHIVREQRYSVAPISEAIAAFLIMLNFSIVGKSFFCCGSQYSTNARPNGRTAVHHPIAAGIRAECRIEKIRGVRATATAARIPSLKRGHQIVIGGRKPVSMG